MILYPAIDLKDGQCVRLYQGSFAKKTVYPVDPIVLAKAYQAQGAEYLHLVDLDGAKTGKPQHLSQLQGILQETHLKVQMGGGIRSKQYAERLLSLGVRRIIIGSLAVKNVLEVQSWIQCFGAEHIVLALDVRQNAAGMPMLATGGWLEMEIVSLWDLIQQYQTIHIKHILCTDISCDGTLMGPNLNLYQACNQHYPEIQFQASGGIGTLEDLRRLKNINLAGAIMGKALYEQKFTLQQALQEVVC